MNRKYLKTPIFLIMLTSMVLIFSGLVDTHAQQAQSTSASKFISQAYDMLNISKIVDVARYFSSFETRATGYPGNEIVASFIQDKFIEYGLENVSYDEVPVVECIDLGANITFSDNSTIKLHIAYPNGVVPSVTPPEGLSGQLIYVGEGFLEDYDFQNVNGSIVILNWNTEQRWVTAAKLGAKAVIFILGPGEVPIPYRTFPATNAAGSSIEGAHRIPRKFLWSTPLSFPRFYVKEKDVETLLSHVGETVTVRSRQQWMQVTTKNIIGFVKGTEYPRGLIVLTAYYDSYSEFPSYAPGAQEALGISTMLEFARLISLDPPPISVMFVALGGHHQSLAGSTYLETQYCWPSMWNMTKRSIGERMFHIFNIDLSTGSDALFNTRVGQMMIMQHVFSGSTSQDPQIYEVAYQKQVVKEVSELTGKEYIYDARIGATYYEPMTSTTFVKFFTEATFVMDHEPFIHAGPFASSFTTASDIRPFFSTPFDTAEKINVSNLETLVRLTFLIIRSYMEDLFVWNWGSGDFVAGCIYGWAPREGWLQAWKKFEYRWWEKLPIFGGGFEMGGLNGTVVEWDPQKSFWQPVGKERYGSDFPNALVVHQAAKITDGYSFINPYRRFYFADDQGKFSIVGYVVQAEVQTLTAWVVDPETGRILFAPNMGRKAFRAKQIYGSSSGSPLYEGISDIGFITVFNASTIALFDILNVDTQTTPRYAEPGREMGAAGALPKLPIISIYRSEDFVPIESYSTFINPDTGTTIVAVMPGVSVITEMKYVGERYPTIILSNSSKEYPLGYGIKLKPGEQLSIPWTTLKIAQDLILVSEERILKASAFMETKSIAGYSDWLAAKKLIDQSLQDIKIGKLSKAYVNIFEAWKLSAKAYKSLRPLLEDSAFVVPVLSLFLIPFAFLAERFFFNRRDISRVPALIGIFGVIVLSLFLLHPGFLVAESPTTIILGTCIIILSAPVIVIILGEVNSLISTLRAKRLGRHEIEVKRASQLLFAFSLGLENMRKRKLRSALSLLTVLLMVSALIGFTSLQTITVRARRSIPGGTQYDGIFIWRQRWGYGDYDLPYMTLNSWLTLKYGSNATVAYRSWTYNAFQTLMPHIAAPNVGQFEIKLNKTSSFYVRALFGLTPEEKDVTEIDYYLTSGRWFIPGETAACIITESQAQKIGVSDLPVKIKISDSDFTVVGIIRDDYWQLEDLNGEWITPLRMHFPPGDINPYDMHLLPEEVLIIDFKTSLALGGRVSSAAIIFKDNNLIRLAGDSLYEFLPGFQVLSNVNGDVQLHGIATQVTATGWQYQLIPTALVMLVILNVLIGSVYERKKDIFIYGSLGLSPMHVAFLFLSETLVYAVVGGIIGYVLSLVQIKTATTLLAGEIIFNYSSSQVMITFGVAIGIVVLSSLYPILLASKMVTPSLKRVWTIPTKPIGTMWEIPFPFTAVNEDEAGGIISYIGEFIGIHEDPDSVAFVSSKPEIRRGKVGEMRSISISTECRMKPFEAGVTQTLEIFEIERPDGKWETQVKLNRILGPMDRWISLSRNMLNLLREQFLLWGALPSEEKRKYTEKYREEIS